MELKTAVKKLEASTIFKEFLKKNSDFFLAHCFTLVEQVQGPWQIGYYSPKKDRVVVFEVDKEISESGEEEVFKKPGKVVKELKLKNVKVSAEKAVKIAEKLCKDNYPNELVKQTIIILQNLETKLYNITFTTETFNLINTHIDANSGKVMSHKIDSILSLKRTDM